jgi:tyrosyl-tRNA synthetase
MAINDELLPEYFLLATNLPLGDVTKVEEELKNGAHPLEIKKKLAHQIVTELHSSEDADKAAEDFKARVQEKELPKEIQILSVHVSDDVKIEDALRELGIVGSNTEGKRLVEQGGVSHNDERVTPGSLFNEKFQNGDILKVGKQRVYKIEKN